MKMKCVYRCIVNGDLVKPDKVLDVKEADAKQEPFKSSFVALQDAAPAPAGTAPAKAATAATSPARAKRS